MADDGVNPNPNGGLNYLRLPSFIKMISGERIMDEMRIPPEWVAIHGADLPFHCRLVMPNGVGWSVRLLQIASGSHFCVGWREFVAGNAIKLGDVLTFTLVDVGTFNVKRYDTKTGCPPQIDTEDVEVDDDAESYPDVDTSDDYEPSETETDSDDDDYVDDRGALDTNGYPEFVVKLTRSHVHRTLELPFRFWQRHIRMGALEAPVYFLADGETWKVDLGHSTSKIWVKRGWRRFKDGNRLAVGVRCHFTLVDADNVQFYVWFDRA